MKEGISVLALLSDPLLDEQGRPLERLDLHRAASLVQQQLQAIDRAGLVRFTVATPDNVLNHVRDFGPFDLLHFYGHGADGSLAFEDGRGGLYPLDTRRLQALFAPDGRPPAPIALLSACHSASMAEALLAAGVGHVIAIDAEEAVLEIAARAFAAHFYPTLFAGRSVREAFDYGRAAVVADPTVRQAARQIAAQAGRPDAADLLQRLETAKFRLLPDDEPARHQAVLFPAIAAGPLRVLGLEPPPPTLPARPDHFTGRQPELHALIGSVLDQRLTTVTGTGGMGKTELCSEAGRWLAAQGYFRGGIHLVRLGAINRASDALKSIAAALRLEAPLPDSAAALARRLPPRSLLILDELDSLVHEDNAAARALVQGLIDYGPTTLLIASRYRTGVTGEKRYDLKRLPPKAALELFWRTAPEPPQGSDREVAELLRFLDGFPRAIVQAAKQMVNPELRWLLEDLRASREEILQDPLIPPEELKDSDSVLVTLHSSLRRLAERYPAAAEFFPYLALFPAGIGEAGLRAIFGQRGRLVRPILEMALVETSPPLDYYYLPAPVRSYAGRRLPAGALEEIGGAALRHYSQVAQGYDQLITTGQQTLGNDLFANELPNLEQFLAWGYEQEGPGDSPTSHSASLTAALRNFFVIFDPDHTRRLPLYQRALATAQRLNDRAGEAQMLMAIGDVQQFRDDRDAALESYAQALERFNAIGDRLGQANVLQAMAWQKWDGGDEEGGLTLVQESLSLYERIGARAGQFNSYWGIGMRLAQKGRLAEAEPLIARAALLLSQIAPGHPAIPQVEGALAQVRQALQPGG